MFIQFYSDEFLVEIMNKKKMVMIQFLMKTFQRPSFYMWKCPECGSFMVLAKTGMEITFTFMSAKK